MPCACVVVRQNAVNLWHSRPQARRAPTCATPSSPSTFASMSVAFMRRHRVHRLRAVLLDEAVGQHHRAEPQAPVEHPLLGEELRHVAAEPADRALLDGDQRLRDRARGRGSAPRSSGLAKRASATVGRMPRARQRLGRLQALGEPRAEGQDRNPLPFQHDPPAADLQRHARARACPPRRPRRAESGRRSAGRRSPPPSPPCAPAPPRPPPPSPRSRAGRRDRRRRTPRHGSARRRRPARPGRWRSAPAAAGSPRRAPPGRSRAAGRSSRSRRTASSPPPPSRRRRSRACCSAMPTSKQRSRKALARRDRGPCRPASPRSPPRSARPPRPRGSATARRPWCRMARSRASSAARRSPRRTSPTPWYLSPTPPPAHSPCPSASAHGSAPARPPRALTVRRIATSCSMSCPSIGPT